MAIVSMQLDPNAAAYTNDEIVGKVNAATATITRASSVAAAARPITAGEISNTELASGATKANLDAMGDIDRGYVKTDPTTGEFKVVSIERKADGKLNIKYDNVAM